MAQKNLGRVRLVFKGAYNSGNTYRELDVVTNDGSSYVSLIDNNEQPLTDTDAWEVLALKGEQGDPGVALGESSDTAYRGDRGKEAYDHSQITSGNPHGTTKSDIGLGNVENKSVSEIKDEIVEDLDYKFDQKENVIDEWVDKDYEEFEKSHKYGIIWEAEEGVEGSDVPGVSAKWKPITQQIKEKEPRNYDKGEIALTPNGEPIVAQRDVAAIENITSTDAFYKVARTNLNTYTFSGTYKN